MSDIKVSIHGQGYFHKRGATFKNWKRRKFYLVNFTKQNKTFPM